MDDYNSSLNFTLNSEDGFFDAVDDVKFYDEDAETIYNHLKNKMKLIPFGDYLKRYIFNLAGFDGKFSDVDIREYQDIIIESFTENATPKSFTETSAKLRALTKNWLTQTSVNRNVIFLLGFGLRMSVRDVSDFLVHAQHEHDFNFKNPFEVICWYCYKNGYKYPKFVQLIDAYNEMPYNRGYLNSDATIGVRDLFMRIDSEDELMAKLAEIKTENSGHLFSVTAGRYFNILYDKAREIIAENYSEDAQAEAGSKASAYLEKSENSTLLSIEEKNLRAAKIRAGAKTYTIDDITEADVEKFLCCGVPFDSKGNLFKFSKSSLAKHFSNKRMSRQHLHDVLSKKSDVDRFDLITLNFFIHAMNDENDDGKVRLLDFINDTNIILNECCMGDMYIANPYECFLQMCMLSDWPMGVYSDVLEKSFENDTAEG